MILPDAITARLVNTLRSHPSLDPDDLRQLVLEGAWLASLRFDPRHGVPLESWCALSALHHARRHLHEAGGLRRSQVRHAIRDRGVRVGEWEALVDADLDLCIDLLRAFERLPANQRAVISGFAHGHDVQGVGECTGYRRRYVHQLAKTAREQLALCA